MARARCVDVFAQLRWAPLVAVAFGMVLAADLKSEPLKPLSAAQGDYLLNCGGCHGFHGVSNAKLVPSLKDLVGYYLRTPEGRAYLPRLPNVAFSTLSDQKLAAVLNYVVFEIGGNSAPVGAKPYDAVEVGRWRKQPLNEVVLSQYRLQLVENLISQHQAPAELRVYGEDPRGN
ncbi:MAG: c-type cytochrome [Steroidobacteraceae bacterium]